MRYPENVCTIVYNLQAEYAYEYFLQFSTESVHPRAAVGLKTFLDIEFHQLKNKILKQRPSFDNKFKTRKFMGALSAVFYAMKYCKSSKTKLNISYILKTIRRPRLESEFFE